jgi:CheY-like chemotaxis protein/signal transduction histidine kinase/methyl-accepting chemotaxis protein
MLSIRSRLILGFALILVFSLATTILALFEMNRIWSNAQGLYEHPFQVTNAAKDVKISTLNIRRYMLDIAFARNTNEIEEAEKLIDREEVLAQHNFDKIFQLYLGDKKDINEAYNLFKGWKTLRTEAFNQIKAGNKEAGEKLILVDNKQYVNRLFKEVQDVIDFASKKAVQFYRESQVTAKAAYNKMLVLFLGSIIICIISAYLITRSITSPLRKVVSNLKEIAKGNLKNDKLPEEKDELGQLAASYNLMQENLNQKAKIAEMIAFGDFSVRIQPGCKADVVANSINRIADNFDMVVKQAQRVALGDFETKISDIGDANSLSAVITEMLTSLKEVVNKARQVAAGDFTGYIQPKSGADELAQALNQMNASLRDATALNLRQNRIKTAQNELNNQMRGDLSIELLASNIITFIARFTKAQIAAFYVYSDDQKGYKLAGSYAFDYSNGFRTFFREGESLVGQVAIGKEMIAFNQLPDNYVKVTSGIGDAVPKNLLLAPCVYNGKTIGVIEIGTMGDFTDEAYELLNAVLENIAITIDSAENREKMRILLATTREQAEELQVQQEELRQSNEELELQTQALRDSEEFLQTQQEELRVTNEELEEKTSNLEQQKAYILKQNQELDTARIEVERKAKDLELTNKYKSEFLANMSHELRTPLNSLLILAQTLMDNPTKNLSKDQVEYSKIIYNSGNDLLNLINDILDLSKIESGKMTLSLSELSISDIKLTVRESFQHIISKKGLEFKIIEEEGLPDQMITDEQRFNQILRNLMSNAIKFTETGHIYFRIFRAAPTDDFNKSGLKYTDTIAFSIEDTGIGISKEKRSDIFEAFQQADGGISRRYGGTGLGLSITRELVKILGGEIKLISEIGQGSVFTVFLPIVALELPQLDEGIATHVSVKKDFSSRKPEITYKSFLSEVAAIPDDRTNTDGKDKSVLIIEDDHHFAEILAEMCRKKGFKCLAAATGEDGIELAKQYLPKGILLDIRLPGMNGWEVLDELKNSADTRHIPVHIISGYEQTIEAFNKGAIGYLIKPVTKEKLEATFDELQLFINKKLKDLLIIEDDDNLRKSIRALLEATDVTICDCNSGHDAINLISGKPFDCIVLDLGLPDMSGFDLLKQLKELNVKIPPVVIYTGKDISRKEHEELEKYTQNIIIKGVKSNERLLDETALFLHRVVDDMPEHQKKMLVNLYDKDQMFCDKKVLVVDDDMRNVFALTQVLEAGKMKVIMAPNGQKALEILMQNVNIDLVLMDIMMPVMNGYEAMQSIRKDKRFEKLPIIALTAKAMKEDREKSIAAGASDYLSKPVDIHKLFNLMRIWLYQ